MKWMKMLATLLMSLTLLAATDSAPQVDNPEFASWNKHEIGTTVVFEYTIHREGFDEIKSEGTDRLVKKSDDECTIEVNVKTLLPAGQPPFKPYTRSVHAKTTQGREYLPDGFKGTFKIIGQETVTVAGQPYDCKIIQIDGMAQETKASGKYWICDDVPGLQVKTEMIGEAEGQKLISKSILKSVEIK